MMYKKISDSVCAEIEARLSDSSDDPRILQIARQKVDRVRDWMAGEGFSGVLLSRSENFAWLTVGGDNHVVKNTELGVAPVLITPTEKYIFAFSMDGRRVMEEFARGQGYILETNDWHEGDPRLKAFKYGGKKVASDSFFPGTEEHAADISLLHDPMSELELDRLRWLGRTTSLIFEAALEHIHPGMSELEIAAVLTGLFSANSIDLDVLLVGTDDRARRIRHFIPSHKKLENYLVMNPSAKRWGLHANVTRCLNFGTPDLELTKSYDIAAAVVADMLNLVKEGVKFSAILEQMKVSYSNHGVPAGWKQHFPGGVTGYVLAEGRCETDLKITKWQAYDWYATMPGIMVEDLTIFGENGLEFASYGEKWPTRIYGNLNDGYRLPEMLLLK